MKRLIAACLVSLFVNSAVAQQATTPTKSETQPGFAGRLEQEPATQAPRPVRHDVAQQGEEIVTLRYFRIKKGSFDEVLRVSREGVWPYFEKLGARVVGMWKVITPEGVAGATAANADYDEAYLMTRYASVAHWQATRNAQALGGNGPDWEKCQQALAVRRGLTLSTSVIFMQGEMAPGGPYFMPALNESYQKN